MYLGSWWLAGVHTSTLIGAIFSLVRRRWGPLRTIVLYMRTCTIATPIPSSVFGLISILTTACHWPGWERPDGAMYHLHPQNPYYLSFFCLSFQYGRRALISDHLIPIWALACPMKLTMQAVQGTKLSTVIFQSYYSHLIHHCASCLGRSSPVYASDHFCIFICLLYYLYLACFFLERFSPPFWSQPIISPSSPIPFSKHYQCMFCTRPSSSYTPCRITHKHPPLFQPWPYIHSAID